MEKNTDDGFKVTVRVSQTDKKALKKLVPNRYLNVSDAVKTAIRNLIEKEKIQEAK